MKIGAGPAALFPGRSRATMSNDPDRILYISGRVRSLLQLALPQHCALCAARVRGPARVRACDARLPRPGPACPVCALPTPDGSVCGRCTRRAPPFAATRAAFAVRVPGRPPAAGAQVRRRARLRGVLRGRARGRRRRHARPRRALPLAPARQRAARLQPGAGNRAARRARCAGCRLRTRSRACATPRRRRACAGATRARNVRGAFVARPDVGGSSRRARRRRDDDRRDARGRGGRPLRARAPRGRGMGRRAYTSAVVTREKDRPAMFAVVLVDAGDPAEHRQRDPPHRQHGDRAASGRAARFPDGRPRLEARRARLSRVRARRRAPRLGRLSRRARRATRARRWFALTTRGAQSLYDARFAARRRVRVRLRDRRPARRGLAEFTAARAAGHPDARRACAASTCRTPSRSPSTRRGGSRVGVSRWGRRAPPGARDSHAPSARGSRRRSSVTAARGDSPSYSTRSTASQIGISMP